METTPVKCPYCGSEEVSLYGKSSTGAQRYLCQNKTCARKTFQLKYKNNASKPGVKEKIVDMVMNGSGTRATGRVLCVSPNTVTDVLKKTEDFAKPVKRVSKILCKLAHRYQNQQDLHKIMDTLVTVSLMSVR